MDNSSKRTAPCRRIEVRENHEGQGFLLVAVTERPDAGKVETLLNAREPITSCRNDALALAELTSRCVEQATGVIYAY